jgi:proteic killer suppression protein
LLILFSDKELWELSTDYNKCKTALGLVRARLFIKRLNLIRAAFSMEDLRHAPGRFHELRGDREGQWSCNLDHPYRMILTPTVHPIPLNEQGGYAWPLIGKCYDR